MSEPPPDDPRFILLSAADNVLVAREAVAVGTRIWIGGTAFVLARTIERGHKIARRAIRPGEKVLKYSAPIGSATAAIEPGEHVHLHNLKSDYTASHVIG